MVLVASCAQCPVIRRRTALRLRGRGPATSAAPGACPGVRDHLPGMQRAPIDATRTRPIAPAHPRTLPRPQEPPCFPLVLDPSSGCHVGPPPRPQLAGRVQRMSSRRALIGPYARHWSSNGSGIRATRSLKAVILTQPKARALDLDRISRDIAVARAPQDVRHFLATSPATIDALSARDRYDVKSRRSFRKPFWLIPTLR